MWQKVLCVAALIALPALSFAGAKSAYDLPDAFDDLPEGRFVVSKNKYFGKADIPLKNRVALQEKNNQVNNFCVVGYRWKRGSMNVWVLWKEEATLILWDGDRYADTRQTSLNRARRNLELGKDTVKTRNEINGSTYLETEQWWHAIADDCMAHGEKYTIKPFKVSKPRRNTE